jgi:hypothetical protein
MHIYNYTAAGEYIGSSEAQLDALQSKIDGADRYLIPANATSIAPPAHDENEIPVFDGSGWSLVPDHRGRRLWSQLTGSQVAVSCLGPIPAGVTDIEPVGDDLVWFGNGWIVDLDKRRARQIAALKASCEAACRAGWTSEALGAPHIYDTEKDRDQVTLTALAVAALQQIMLGNTAWTCDVTCTAVASGIKAMRPHTAAQLAQVGTEVQAMIAGHKQRYYTVVAELEAAFQAGDAEAMRVINFGGAI